MAGYIKIYRNILEWEWWSDINTYRLFTYMLLKANWKDGKFKGFDVPKGSFVSSLSKLSEGANLTVNEVRTALKHLIKTGEVTSKPHGKFTVFTVKNYCMYQDDDTQITSNAQGINKDITSNPQEDNKELTSRPHPINNLLTTIEKEEEGKKGRREKEEEGKKGKRGKKEGANAPKKSAPAAYYPNDEKLNQAFLDYAEMRKKIKKPMTDRAVELNMGKLRKLSADPISGAMDNDLAVRILEQSIMNCWQGLFPIKESAEGRGIIDEWRKA